MSTTKERYEEFKKEADDHFEGLRDPITDYVTELEQQVKISNKRRKELVDCLNNVKKQNHIFAQQIEKLKKAIDFYYKFRKDSRNDGIILEEFKKVCPTK